MLLKKTSEKAKQAAEEDLHMTQILELSDTNLK
jgi:hypothetical protein